MSGNEKCALLDEATNNCGVTGQPCDKKTEEEIKDCPVKKEMYEELR
jgi:hypothetical protein